MKKRVLSVSTPGEGVALLTRKEVSSSLTPTANLITALYSKRGENRDAGHHAKEKKQENKVRQRA